MTSRHILYIPGKNPKPDPEQHRELLLKVMLEGIKRYDTKVADDILSHQQDFQLIGWNHLFYHQFKDMKPEMPWVDALLNKHGPSEAGIQETRSWHYRFNRYFFILADHLQFIIPMLPKAVESATTEINRYFRNENGVADEIRQLLKQQLRPLIEKHEPILLVTHSMGSIIAYDALWELTWQENLRGKVDLLTMGSPLGMHYVHRRLLGMNKNATPSYPKLIRNWFNIASEGDIIALERNFHKAFEPMLKAGVVRSISDHCHGIYNFYRDNNGLNCHRSYGYLVNPATGSIIADWWNHQ